MSIKCSLPYYDQTFQTNNYQTKINGLKNNMLYGNRHIRKA